jgi:hypothetical protein
VPNFLVTFNDRSRSAFTCAALLTLAFAPADLVYPGSIFASFGKSMEGSRYASSKRLIGC